MEQDSYKTIVSESSGFFKEKGSKFHGYAFPVQNVEDVKECIDRLKKEHYAARHHCYAYRIGPYGKEIRANDDGEPSNSAGNPILGQIQAFDLTNTLVVVVRYFGGTKLGVGGLIQAYKTGAYEALSVAEILEKTIDSEFEVHFGYPELNLVMRKLKDLGQQKYTQDFQENCVIRFSIRKGDAAKAISTFSNLKNITIEEI
jgi:uncharacterized YigZ family protein